MATRMRIRITRTATPEQMADELRPAMRRLTNAIHRRAQRLVPKRTWALHDSIVSDVEDRSPGRIVGIVGVGGLTNGTRVDYWDYVERGTSRQKAQPYMRPALLQSGQRDLTFVGQPDPKRGGGGRP